MGKKKKKKRRRRPHQAVKCENNKSQIYGRRVREWIGGKANTSLILLAFISIGSHPSSSSPPTRRSASSSPFTKYTNRASVCRRFRSPVYSSLAFCRASAQALDTLWSSKEDRERERGREFDFNFWSRLVNQNRPSLLCFLRKSLVRFRRTTNSQLKVIFFRACKLSSIIGTKIF